MPFKTFGTISLITGYIVFASLVIFQTWDQAWDVLATGDTSYMTGTVSVFAVIWSGILYVGYNLAVYPATLFSIERQQSRKESVWSGIIAGILMTVPWFLTYFSFLGHYPAEKVMGASLPWLVMLSDYPIVVTIFFGVVVGWTLIATASGMVHAFIDRLDSQIGEDTRKMLSAGQKGAIAICTLVLAVGLAQVGIIALISKGYTAMAYGMIIVFAIPLLTIGVYKILDRKSVV